MTGDKTSQSQDECISMQFCTSQKISWMFITERLPYFGSLWESCVNLRANVSCQESSWPSKNTWPYQLAQVEAPCLNSCPLTGNDDGYDALTPGHFEFQIYRSSTRGFVSSCYTPMAGAYIGMQRWPVDYLAYLRRYAKWHNPSPNISVGDIVVLK